MPLEPFPRVLGDLASRKATGRLQVRAGSVTREIFLKQGDVVQARSRTMKEALGRLLLDQGWVSEAQIDEALATAAAEGRQLGDVLIAKGFLSPSEVLEALTEQIKLRVFNAFRLSEYEWSFEEGALPEMCFQVRLPAAASVWRSRRLLTTRMAVARAPTADAASHAVGVHTAPGASSQRVPSTAHGPK